MSRNGGPRTFLVPVFIRRPDTPQTDCPRDMVNKLQHTGLGPLSQLAPPLWTGKMFSIRHLATTLLIRIKINFDFGSTGLVIASSVRNPRAECTVRFVSDVPSMAGTS